MTLAPERVGRRLVPAPAPAHRADRILLQDLAAHRDAIGLDEVNAVAELQTRVDQKYLVSLGVLSRLLDALGPDLRVLEIDGIRVFDYLSVYFDTPDLRFFRDHHQGRRIRYKVRTRSYLDTDLTVLEVKAKGARGETVKHRVPWRPEAMDRLAPQGSADGLGFIDAHLNGDPPAETLRPSLVSRYRRTTFVDPVGGVRLTCDIDLSFDGSIAGALVGRGGVLVETKSATGRSTADQLLHRLGQRPGSISKYCAGIAITAGRRAPRWHRVLRKLDPLLSGPWPA